MEIFPKFRGEKKMFETTTFLSCMICNHCNVARIATITELLIDGHSRDNSYVQLLFGEQESFWTRYKSQITITVPIIQGHECRVKELEHVGCFAWPQLPEVSQCIDLQHHGIIIMSSICVCRTYAQSGQNGPHGHRKRSKIYRKWMFTRDQLKRAGFLSQKSWQERKTFQTNNAKLLLNLRLEDLTEFPGHIAV